MSAGTNGLAPPAPAIFWDIAQESLDEAAFFWGLRDTALLSPERRPFDVETAIEARLRGAIDGVAIPDDALVDRLLTPGLEGDDPSIVAVAAHALLAGDTPVGRERFCAAFCGAAGARLATLRRGLELLPIGDSWVAVADRIEPAAGTGARAAFLEACAFRALPVDVDHASLLAPSAPVELQRAAARLLRHAPPGQRAAWLGPALALPDRQARAAALEAGLIWGDAQAVAFARALAQADVAAPADLLWQLGVVGSARDVGLLCAAAGDARRRRAAIWALGFAGWRAGADLCVDLLAQGIEPRLAGEAFGAITGLDLRAAGLALPAPPALEDAPAFEDDDLDADLVPAAELFLPAPDVPGVIRWWNQHRPRFQPGVRYLGGRPSTVDRLVEALQQGPMRRRRPLAFELAVRTAGRVQIQTGAFLGEQRRQLAGVGAQAASAPPAQVREAGATCFR